jgi:hypothetical protein
MTCGRIGGGRFSKQGAGDHFNYELWLHVTMAINEIDFNNPSSGETIN